MSTWFNLYHPCPQATLRLCCFHSAGSGASLYRTWAKHFAPQVEVVAIQLPGREERSPEPALTQIPPLIRELTPVLMAYLGDRPFACFGHSLGALLAFDFTRQLRRLQGPQPRHLFVSSREAPQGPRPRPCHTWTDAQLVHLLRQYGGTPEAILQTPEIMAVYLPILRADLALNGTYYYTPEPPLACPITAFVGRDDSVKVAQLQLWEQQTAMHFEAIVLPGGHMYLKDQAALLWSVIQQRV